MSYHALPRRDLILTVAGLMLGLLLAALDQTIVGTAMPRIVSELQGFEHYAWVTTAAVGIPPRFGAGSHRPAKAKTPLDLRRMCIGWPFRHS